MNHPDPLDRAQVESELALQNILAARKIYTGKSSLYCHDCGEPIPQARRDAVPGCSFCAECQRLVEFNNR